MALEKELATYERRLPELLANEGKFVVIHGEDVAGTWHTYEDALAAGYQKFGLEPFLIQQIESVEIEEHLGWEAGPCQSSTSPQGRTGQF
jgi:hypothetical protein